MLRETSTYKLWTLQPNEDLDLLIKIGEQPSKIAPVDSLYSQNCLFADKDDKDIYYPIGSVCKDGQVYYESAARPKWAMFVIPKSGKPYITHTPPAIADRKLSFYGTPQILKGGKVDITSAKEGTAADIANSTAIRSAIGIKADGQIGLLVTKTNHTLRQLADLMLSLGFTDALNMDGGGSTATHKKGDPHVWQRPTSSALYVKQAAGAAPKPTPAPTDKPILIIDPGHGGIDPGASGNGIIEKEYTLKISLYQYERYKQLGVPVALTRDKDITLESTPRTNIVKSSGAKYCISNHINAGGGKGVETIHSIYASDKKARALANAIAAEGQKFRRVFTRTLPNDPKKDYYYMHRQTGSVETTIVEYGFVDHAADAARVKDNWQRYAEAVVKAFCELVGHPYAPPKHEEQPQTNKLYRVQVGAFSMRENAERLAKELQSKGYPTIIKEDVK